MKATFTCQIKTLTPVHVGSGKNYMRNADFDLYNNWLTVYDAHRLQKAIAEAGKEVAEQYYNYLQAQERPSVFGFLKKMQWPKRNFVKYEIAVDSGYIFDIKAQIKNGFGLPLLPGSSIKGALRTAIWKYLVEQVNNEREIERRLPKSLKIKEHQADQQVKRFLLGENPNDDWMRVLQVSDATFNKEDLDLFKVKILTQTNEGYALKQLGKFRKNLAPQQVSHATTILLEALKAGVTSQPFEIALDAFLLNHEKFKPTDFDLPDKDAFWKQVDSHFRELAEKERQFFRQLDFKEAERFYERDILGRPSEEGTYLMRLSWGGGWRFTTGDWLTEQQKAEIRRVYGLGRKGVREFPKTRRLVVENGKPYLPLGWVQVKILNGKS